MAETLLSYNELLKLLKNGPVEGAKPLRLAILADFASQFLTKAIEAACVQAQFSPQVFEADYDAIDVTVMHATSELYSGHFDYILLFFSSLKAYREFSASTAKNGFATARLESLQHAAATIAKGTKARIILSNFAEYDDRVFGNYANKTPDSFLYQTRKLNFGLMEWVADAGQIFINDVQSLQVHAGRASAFDPRLHIHGDVVFGLDFMAQLALNTVDIIKAIEGRFKKCIIIDLDNTMWGGIIGDDGMERIEVGDLGIGKAFTGLQYWLRNLKDRGIILAVCSKNSEDIAKEPFEKHPGMVLRLEDISVFVANWENKVDNIAFIREVLNIGYDSMVFLDDNAFERGMVREFIPEITVPELPEDPALYLEYLQSLNLFETASYTASDTARTNQYREEAGRAVFQKKFDSEKEFLQRLDMLAEVGPVNQFTLPRVAQLTQRSNQFNLRTVRYTEAELAELIARGDVQTLTISLKDTFGDYGLISAVILQQKSPDLLFIDTWIMSCRVLKRGVEDLVLNEIVRMAQETAVQTIVGEYLPTAKNALVKDHYQQLGFTQNLDGRWMLRVVDYVPKDCAISIRKR